MNRWLRATLSLIFVGIALVWMGSTSTSVAAGPAEKAKPLHARAVISGPGGIFGEVDFKQHACDGCRRLVWVRPLTMGDLPNLIVNHGGEGHLKHTTSRITLSPGPLSVFDENGSAVVVHLNPDRGMTGVAGASGEPRIACSVIL
jgi:hypothetical protein